ncbi:MAG TPA: hypothetical protein VKD90_12225 [Gemmataceae bacterium]|nr:hypothetical protein [Gemmataceae bacterium]
MKKPILFALAATAVVLGPGVVPVPAAPTLGEKPAKWEYCEVQYRRTARGFGEREAQPGGLGGAPGGLQPVPAAAQPAIKLITGEEEIEVKSWEELASKLKAPAPKKEGSAALHKLRVLNRLGADGWELMGHTGGDGVTAATAGTWTFKRRLP